MPSPTRRTLLRSAVGLAVVGSAGCLGGNDRGKDDTDRDFLVLANHSGAERVVSLAVNHDASRVRSGRFRVPTGTAIHLDDGFAWGTYEIWGKLNHDDPAYEECPTEFGGFGGGGGGNRPKSVGDRRIGDLDEGPPSETTDSDS